MRLSWLENAYLCPLLGLWGIFSSKIGHTDLIIGVRLVDPSAAADRRICRRKFVRRKSAGKITARRISRQILLAVNPP